MILKFILIGGVLPGAVMSLVLLALWWTRRKGEHAGAGPRWAMPVGVCLSVWPAELLIRGGLPSAWPVASTDRIVHMCGVVMLFALTEGMAAKTKWTAALRFGAAGAVLWMLLHVLQPGTLTMGAAVGIVVSIAGVCAVVGTLLDGAAEKPGSGLAVTVGLFAAVNAVPVVLVNNGIASLAQLAGGIAAAVGAGLFVSVLAPAFTMGRGGVSAVVTLSGVFLTAGWFFAPDGLPRSQAVFAAAAFAGPLVVFVPGISGRGRWVKAGVSGLVSAILAGIAAGLSVMNAPPPTGY